MSQLPTMPIWVADFFSKTDHLSNEEQWAYLKLMMKTWVRNCRALPDSDTDIARLLNMGVKRWRRIRPRIAPFFDLSGSNWVQPNLENVFREVSERRANIVSAARLGGMVKSNKIKDIGSAPGTAGAVPIKDKDKEEDSPNGESPPIPPIKAEGENVRRGTKQRLPADWEPSAEDRDYARTRGLDPERVLVDFREYWSDPDTRNPLHSDWSRVWQRRCRDLEARPGRNGFARPNGHNAGDNSVVTAIRELWLEENHGRIPH